MATTTIPTSPFIFSLFFLSLFILTSSLHEPDILLTFKASIEDSNNSLSTWSNTSSTHFCNWVGITCSTTTPPSIISLNLQNLNLSGEISSSICQLPNLSQLNLANNIFNQPIPLHLSQCTSLQTLNLSNNLIWGTIPDQVSLFSSLKVLDLKNNHIEGKIPENLGSLKNLQVLNLGSNLFTGNLPSYIFGNFSELVVLDLSENPFLMSEIPSEFGTLEKLQQLLLQRSGSHGLIPDSFVGLHGLEVLDLSQNNLTGGIPPGLGLSCQKLKSFDVSQNKLSGSFPTDICHGKSLINLGLHTNIFTGSIPESFEKCLNLEKFQVQNNGFNGSFSNQLWSLPKIKLIRAENNRFTGEIPDTISMAAQLEQVQIDNNRFNGRIPQGLGLVKSLYRFSASLNSLYGDLPQNFCDSPVMSIINLSHNSISGRIPELTKCRKLVSLSLADNSLIGEIPSSLAQLPVLTYLDLSDNNLTGSIPLELQNVKLALFNVSYNKLSGKVPLSLISGLPSSSLEGNSGLCGPGLPNSCSNEHPRRVPGGISKSIFILISIAFAIAITVFATVFFIMFRSSKQNARKSYWNSVFFCPLEITEEDLLMGIDDKIALYSGGTFGRVHIIRLASGEIFAVKKLMNNGVFSLKTLKSEIKTLGKIRHKNITKLLGFFHSDDSILLIYEFVKMGSLGDLICKLDDQLEWQVRLSIAIGAAQGLAYLHKDYVPQLLHRNIKSRNILLDKDFEPKLTDYALDRVVGEIGYQAIVSSEMGSSCYIAPEYGHSKKATEQMDIYSFGVILLELVTGKQAEKIEPEDPIDVVKWVRRKINTSNGAIQVLDSKIASSFHQEMLGVLDIALLCTSVMPEKRPTMCEVLRSLQSVHPNTQY